MTDEAFNKFINSFPKTHWSKYDLSAVRLGWDGGIQQGMLQAAEMMTREAYAVGAVDGYGYNSGTEYGYRNGARLITKLAGVGNETSN